MKNKEKALELSSMNRYGFSVEESNAAYNAALEMAYWKDDYYDKVITEIVGAAYNSCEDHSKIDEVLKKYKL